MFRLTENFFNSVNGYNTPELQKIYMENLSTYYFPGDLTAFYSSIVERRCREDIICNFTGSIIKKGNIYISYRPLIENLNNGSVFVLKKTIKCETAYSSYLPNNIMELEAMNQKIMNHENINNTEYSNLYYYQNGELMLQKLKRRNYGKRK